MQPTSPRLPDFVDALTQLHDTMAGDEAALVAAVTPLLASLVRHDDWLPAELTRPDPAYYQQYLLHTDPADRFSIVSFVWGPGQKTPVHDHTVWGLIGMLRGAERGQRYELGAPGEAMQPRESALLQPGEVEHVSPSVGDIHQVCNAYDDRVSISIHVYGGNIGRTTRHVYDPQTSQAKAFVSGYSNPGLPTPC